MFEFSFPLMAVWANAAVLAIGGLVNMTALRAVREIYARWDIPGAFYRTLGIVEIIAAALLGMPQLRVLGIGMAAPIMFGSIVMLLNHRHYLYAVPAMLAMAALVPGTLATQQPHSYLHYASAELRPMNALAGGHANAIMIANARQDSTPSKNRE
jgi:DoxX-like family